MVGMGPVRAGWPEPAYRCVGTNPRPDRAGTRTGDGASIVNETLTTVAFGMPGGWEWIIIGVIGLLIFGRRLPEVGRSIGQGIVEFKKGLKGIQDDMDSATRDEKPSQITQGEGRPSLSQSGEAGADERRVSQAGGSA